jgi:hypothetical protein
MKVHHTENVIQKNNWYAYEVGFLTDAQNLPENFQLRPHIQNSTKIHEVVYEMKHGWTDG